MTSNKISPDRQGRTLSRENTAPAALASVAPRSVSADVDRYANSLPGWLADAARLDVMTNRMRETITDALAVERGAMRELIREDTSMLESSQAEFLEQQAAYMKAILQHLQNLTENVAGLQDKYAQSLAHSSSYSRSPVASPRLPSPQEVANQKLLRVPEEKSWMAPHSSYVVYPSPPLQEEQPVTERTACSASPVIESLHNPRPAEYSQDLLATRQDDGEEDEDDEEPEEHLKVTIVGAVGLPNKDSVGKSDPYCVCKLANRTRYSARSKFCTPVIDDNLDPEWNFKGALAGYSMGEDLSFAVYDKDLFGDVILGEVTLESDQIRRPGGFKGDLELQTAGELTPILTVEVTVVDGPYEDMSHEQLAEEMVHEAVTVADNDASARVMAEAQQKMTMQLIRRLPSKRLRTLLANFLVWHNGLVEPVRWGILADAEASKNFMLMSLMVVVFDQFLTVLSTNENAAILVENGETSKTLDFLEDVCLVWFTFELVLKCFVHRLFFFVGSEWRSNLLDLALVVLGFAEAISFDLSFLRALRVFKAAKIVRMFRALRAVRDLRVMMDCLIASGYTFFWGVVMIYFLLYMFALIFVQAMVEHVSTYGDSMDTEVMDLWILRFGSIQQGILSLFMALTGAISWGEVYDLVALTGPIAAVAMIFFVLLFSMSVWNIIGSVYVEKVMAMAEPTSRELMEKQMIQHKVDIAEIEEFFQRAGKDHDDSITEKEWNQILQEGGLASFLEVRNVELQDKADTKGFFRLMQEVEATRRTKMDKPRHTCKKVKIDTIITMLCKVKGDAKRVELALLKNDMHIKLNTVSESVSGAINELKEELRAAIHALGVPQPITSDGFEARPVPGRGAADNFSDNFIV